MAYPVRSRSDDDKVLDDIDHKPDTCPACGKGMDPIFCFQYGVDTWRRYDGFLQIVFRCPLRDCQKLFIAKYTPSEYGGYTDTLYLRRVYLMDFIEFENFSDNITIVSEQFTKIYNQAKMAEENGLNMVAGPGYRKALEFLVKDYLKKNDNAAFVKAKNLQLGPTIQFIEDDRIRDMAERAAWLGNDETHYIRKFEDKDINDLKNLIGAVVAWIELVERSSHYKKAMTAKKPAST